MWAASAFACILIFTGGGVGRALMAEMIHLADNWSQSPAPRTLRGIREQRAIALYRSFGFEVEGEFKMDLSGTARYGDTTQMARLSFSAEG